MEQKANEEKCKRRRLVLLRQLQLDKNANKAGQELGQKLGIKATSGTRAKSDDDVVIVSAVRTPIGKGGRGLLKATPPDDLLATVLTELRKRIESHGMKPEEVGDITVGTLNSVIYQLRAATLLAGFPEKVPTRKVDRACSSGLQAVADIAYAIKAGQYSVGIAAGVESMSLMTRSPPPQNPKVMGTKMEGVYSPMGITSENVAKAFNISRQKQDEYSVQSHKRAAAAVAAGKFKDEIVPVVVDDKATPPVVLDKDEGIRGQTTLEDLAKLKPAFKADGSTTAGNSSQVSDGASAVLLMTRRVAREYGWEVLGRFVSFAVVGCAPEIMGIGPYLAIPEAVKKAGLTLNDIDLFEINEAFASQFSYCVEQLGLNMDKVNVNGGAIALGHPLGCTGARLTTALLYEMKRRRNHYGVVSMCIGSGQGAAAVFESEN